MGTRGLLGYIICGQRYAAYNHFDSYPDGLGAEILAFLLTLDVEQWKKMLTMIKDIEWVDGDSKPSKEIQDKYVQLGFSDAAVNRQNPEDWYALSRNVQGAKALPQILNGNLKHLVEEVKFLDDKMMCEWAYFIDFEEKSLETWKAGVFVDKVVLDDEYEIDAGGYMSAVARKAYGASEDYDEDEHED